MEKVFGTVHISGAEGWSAQQGEEQLDTMILETTEDPIIDSDAASESRQNIPLPNQETATSHSAPSSSNRPRASRKRPREAQTGQVVADVIRDNIKSCVRFFPIITN